MKLGLISDINGNVQALEAVLATLKPHGIGLILCAGDLVCYLKSLPWRLDYRFADKQLALFHGGLDNLDEWVSPDLIQSLDGISKRTVVDVVILSHTHGAFAQECL
jgi:predicted phosphodiesterase